MESLRRHGIPFVNFIRRGWIIQIREKDLCGSQEGRMSAQKEQKSGRTDERNETNGTQRIWFGSPSRVALTERFIRCAF